MIAPFKKRCGYCRGSMDPGLMELFPRVVGLPQVRCSRCNRSTKLSLVVTVASIVAGCVGAGFALAGYCAIAGWLFGVPLGDGPILLMLPIAVVAWILGYIVFAMGCYGIHGLWIASRGTD